MMKAWTFFAFLLLARPVFGQLDLYFEAGTDPDLSAFSAGSEILFWITDDNEFEVVYRWDFGNGETLEGANVSYSFSDAGVYEVSVTPFVDNVVAGRTWYRTVFINPLNGDTTVGSGILSPDDNGVFKAGSAILFDAVANADPVTFYWRFADTELSFTGPTITLETESDWAGLYGYMSVNAVNADGFADTYADGRTFYLYGEHLPPDVFFAEPEGIVDNFLRVNLGESVTLRLDATPGEGPLPLSYSFVLYDEQSNQSFITDNPWTWTPEAGGLYLLCGDVQDANGLEDPFSACINVLVKTENNPPVAWIGEPSQTFEVGEPVCLSADGDDPDGDPLNFSWDLGDGRTTTGQALKTTYETPGVYQITLSARDDSGSEAPPFQRWVFINDYAANPANQSPAPAILAPLDGEAFPVNQVIEMAGFAYDELEEGLSFYWDFGDGNLAQGQNVTKAYTQACESYGSFCAYGVQLFVRDEQGLATEYGDSIQLVIYDGEVPPDGIILQPELAPPSDEPFVFDDPVLTLLPGQTLVLEGGVRGVDDLNGYSGRFTFEGDGENFEISGIRPDPIPFEDFPGSGDWFVFWHPVSPTGQIDPVPAYFRLRVRAGNSPPEYVEILEPGWDRPIELGDGLDLAAYAEDQDGDEITFEWKLTEIATDNPVRCLEGERLDFVTFERPGLYEIALNAVDSRGASTPAKARRYVVVFPDVDDIETFNYPPYIEKTAPTEERVLIQRQGSVTFAGEAKDEEGDAITGYFWNFGNGVTSTAAQPPPVTYMEPGFYDVTAYARDANGLWSFYPAYWGVYVFGNNIPPVSSIVDPPLTNDSDEFFQRLIPVLPGTELTFTGAGSDRDGNLPLAPVWYINGEPCVDCSGFSTPPISFDEVDLYDVSFTVLDSAGEADPFGDYRVVKVIDPEQKPETYIIEPAVDITVEPGEPVYFFGFGEDPNDLPVSLTWNFGEARVEGTANEEEVYPVYFDQPSPPGQPYVVSLTSSTAFTSDETPATVRITVKSFTDAEFEPNNGLDAAADLNAGSYGNLSLDADDAADNFAFEVAEAGKDLRLQFSAGDEAGVARLRLYRDEGGSFNLVDVGSLDESGGITLENMPVGRYVVEAALTEAAVKRKMSLSYALSVTTLEPSLFLPFLVEDGSLRSKLGIINTTASVADLAITGLDEFGRTIVTQSLELPARGRMFVDGSTFFGRENNMERARDIRWVKVLSTRRLVGYTNAETRDRSQLMSVGAVRSLSAGMLVPHIAADTAQWYTRAVVVNVDEDSSPVDFRSSNEQIALTESLKSNHQMDFRFTDVFQQELPGWGEVRNRKNRDTLAGFELFGRVDGRKEIAALEMVDVRKKNPNFVSQSGNLFFSHVAQDTQNWWTGLSLINLDSTDAVYNIVGYDDSGSEMARMDNCTLSGGGKMLDVTTSLFPDAANISWVKIETDGNLGGFELFGDHSATRLSGFQAARSLTDVLYFPHLQTDNGLWTGIALLNVSTQSLDLEVAAYDDAGTMLDMSVLTMAPQTKLVRLAEALFDGGLPEGATYLRVSAPQKAITGFELFGSLPAAGLADDQFAGLRALRE